MTLSIVLFWIASASSFYLFRFLDFGIALVFSVLFLLYVARRDISTTILVGIICAGLVVGYIIALRREFTSFTTEIESVKVYSFIFEKKSADNAAEYIYNMFTHFTSPNAAAFFSALITGRRSFIPLALQDIIRRSGISHLLALSGFHLSVLFVLASSLKVCFHRRIFEILSIILVWVYCLWIGFIPSLWRAAIMYSITVGATILTGIKNFSVAWSMAGIIMIFASSETLYSPGFILSMLALCGVVWGGVIYTRAFVLYFSICIRGAKKLLQVVWSSKNNFLNIIYNKITISPFIQFLIKTGSHHISIPFSISLGAAGATALYSFFVFGTSYPIGIITSVLLTPIVVIFMFLGIVLLALHFVLQLFGEIIIAKNIIFILQSFLGNMLTIMSDAINATLSRASSMFSITTLLGVILLYIFLIGILMPYIFLCIRKRLGIASKKQ